MRETTRGADQSRCTVVWALVIGHWARALALGRHVPQVLVDCTVAPTRRQWQEVGEHVTAATSGTLIWQGECSPIEVTGC